LVIGGKCKESIFGKGRVARKHFIGGKSKTRPYYRGYQLFYPK
jgi:hypothetical protein